MLLLHILTCDLMMLLTNESLFLGQRFAMLEIKSVISSILRMFEILRVDTPENLQIVMDLVLRPANGLHVKFQPRSSPAVDYSNSLVKL